MPRSKSAQGKSGVSSTPKGADAEVPTDALEAGAGASTVASRASRERRASLGLAVLVGVIALGAYANALSNGFVYDDVPQVVENPWIRDLGNLPNAFATHVAGFRDNANANYYRPLMHVAYSMTYAVVGAEPVGYHLVNVALHAVTSVLIFLLLLELARGRGLEGRRALYGAAFAASVFAVHPIHTEAVTWVAGVPDVLAGLFVTLSLYLYVRERRTGTRAAYVGSVVAFALALLSKEPAFGLLAVLVVFDFAAGRRALHPRSLLRYLPFAVIALTYLAVRTYALGDLSPVARHAELSGVELALNAFALWPSYLGSLVVPIHLNAFHSFHPVHSAAELPVVVGILAAIGYGAAFVVAMRRSPTVALALALIAVPLLPVHYIPAVGEATFSERYLYVPSIGYAVLVALAWWRASAWSRPRARIAAGGLVAVLALYALGTVQRNPVWRNELSLWSDTVAKSPDAYVPRTQLGDALFVAGDLAGAIEHYEVAIALDATRPDAHNNLGMAYLRSGRHAEAIDRFLFVTELEPRSPMAFNNLGLAYKLIGRLDDAIAAYTRAFELAPNHPGLCHNLANAYDLKGDALAARRYRQRAVELERALR